jgi:hypothetical protein
MISANTKNSTNTKLTSARAFIRSLNILLKYARLYSFNHTRTAEQFEIAWNELHESIPVTNESGLLLSATGTQLLLDGAPIDSSPAERSFAQLLSAAGLASIQFTSHVTKDDLERLIRAFPTHNTKPSALAEQLKAALSGVKGIRINEIRYVAEDSSNSKSLAAGLLTQTLGADAGSMKDWLSDPQKLLQLIAAAEGSHTEPGDGMGGEGTGDGSGSGRDGGTGSSGTGAGFGGAGGGTAAGSGVAGGGSGTGIGIGGGDAGTGVGIGGAVSGRGGAAGLGGGHGTGISSAGSGNVARSGGASGGGHGTGAGIGTRAGDAGTGTGVGGTGGGTAAAVGGSGSGGSSGVGAGVGPGGGDGGAGTGIGGAGSGTGTGSASGTGGTAGAGTGLGGVGSGTGSGSGTGTGGKGGTGTGAGGSGSGSGSSRVQRGTGATGTGSGAGTGSGGLRGTGGSGGPNRSGSGFLQWSAKDEDILGILKLLTNLGHTVAGEGAGMQPGPLHEELTKLPAQSQEMLRQALAAVAAQAPATNSKDPMLLRLAEHLAIRFALERYERGEVKVNAVRQMIDRMSQEIEGLRKILGGHEQKLADAGIMVESNADLLDRQFWAAVPETGKRAVLTSSDAWCIPARNVRQYVEELVQRGDEKMALEILRNYASSVQSPEFEARRRTAIGIADLADLYASFEGKPLAPAIQVTGAQLSVERDDNLQGLISAAFVRLAQEAGTRRMFPALLQALDSLDAVENQRPVFAQSLRPRMGLEKRVPEFLEDVLRGNESPKGLDILLQRMPRTTAENLVLRFNRTGNRIEMQRLTDLARAVGDEIAAPLRDTLRTSTANEAAETVGLLSRLDSSSIERWLAERVAEWPRNAQDRAVRLLAMGGAAERGSLLTNMLHLLDPVLLALAIDEIGLSEDASCIPSMMRLAEGDMTRSGGGPFIRLKAIEALGRLRALEAAEMLRVIAETRHMFRWTHPSELRLAAVQSLAKIDEAWGNDFIPRSGFSSLELSMAPLDPLPNAKYFRRRRYPRVRLGQLIPATATSGQDTYRLEIRGLSLSGGIALGEKHLQPGSLVTMKLGSLLRPIRAQVLMRDARAQGLGFEIADMDLDERARLRKLLLDNKSSSISSEQEVIVQSSV